ncbi:MAG: hypothetical protein IH946_10975, partial [Bacteroidetes bacterium]|nr:hypothetical protein [Bacteroidota bacterium]
MRTFTLITLLFVGLFNCKAQTVLLTDNLSIPSDTTIKFTPGNYSFQDPTSDGVIQIIGQKNVILDGDSVDCRGTTRTGYFFYIENCDSVEIRNFKLVSQYFYAAFVKNSQNIIFSN